MKYISKVEQEIEGNKWCERNIKTVQSQSSLTEKQFKTIICEALTYYLIDAISFRMFIETVDQIGERPEIRTMPEIKEVTNQLLSLSQYAFKPETGREEIIDTFSLAVQKLLQE